MLSAADDLTQKAFFRFLRANLTRAPELLGARFQWLEGEPIPELFRPVGCPTCSKTGYRGRIALHEVMAITEDIERHAVAHSSAADIAATRLLGKTKR